jgi:hypothetical protein
MPRVLRMIFRRDLPAKGITWSREHLRRKINDGEFPPPDGRTTDSLTSPQWWWEHTIDGYMRDRAKKTRVVRQAAENAVAAD